MYRSKNDQQLEFPDFYLPFSGHLDAENRWVVLARLVPWDLAERIYHQGLCEDFGAPIVPSRVALGALIIKERLGLTDRETVEAIRENPYLQFFIGLEEFTQDKPFDASLMVDFRKRIGEEGMQRIGEAIALASLREQEAAEASCEDDDPTEGGPKSSSGASSNRGKLIADATCAPGRHSLPDRRQPAERSAGRKPTRSSMSYTNHSSATGRGPAPIVSKHVASSLLLPRRNNQRGKRFGGRSGSNSAFYGVI